MAIGRSSVFFLILVALAAGAAAFLVWSKRPPGPEAPPPPGPAGVPPGPVKGPAPGPSGKKPVPPPEPAEKPIEATPGACLAFLRAQAGPPRPPEGGGMILVFPGVRAEALDALSRVPGFDAAPVLRQAAEGDGDPTDWSEDRLLAAGLRAKAGDPEGGETVKAFLREEQDLVDSDAVGAAALAATWMKPEEGGNVVRRLLAEDFAAYGDENHQAAILQAAAALGAGATPADLKKVLDAEEGEYEAMVLGAAAGALLRAGDESGRKAMAAIAEGEWFEGEEFAAGLGARGNEAAVPWLAEIARVDDTASRASAARSLGVVGGPKAIAALRGMLADADPSVKGEAAVSLALLGEKEGLAEVRKAAASADAELSARAWRALAIASDAESRAAAAALLAIPLPPSRDFRRGPALQQRVWAALLVCRLGK